MPSPAPLRRPQPHRRRAVRPRIVLRVLFPKSGHRRRLLPRLAAFRRLLPRVVPFRAPGELRPLYPLSLGVASLCMGAAVRRRVEVTTGEPVTIWSRRHHWEVARDVVGEHTQPLSLQIDREAMEAIDDISVMSS